MPVDLSDLLEKAFFVETVSNVTEAIDRALQKYEATTHPGALSFELAAPADPDETWARERLLRPLVYFCQSEGRPIPAAPGVVVSLFVDNELYCIAAHDVVLWAADELGLPVDALADEFGTHERDTVIR
jgi:hypothetical protein